MTRKEVSERFNALPKEHRVTIIGNDIEQEIRCFEREKRNCIKSHQANMRRLSSKIKMLEKALKDLED